MKTKKKFPCLLLALIFCLSFYSTTLAEQVPAYETQRGSLSVNAKLTRSSLKITVKSDQNENITVSYEVRNSSGVVKESGSDSGNRVVEIIESVSLPAGTYTVSVSASGASGASSTRHFTFNI